MWYFYIASYHVLITSKASPIWANSPRMKELMRFCDIFYLTRRVIRFCCHNSLCWALQARECTPYALFGTTLRSQVTKWFRRKQQRSNNRIARSIKVYFCDFWLRKAIRCFVLTSWKLVYTNSPNIAHLSLIRWHAVLLSQLPQRYLLCMRRCIDIAVTVACLSQKGVAFPALNKDAKSPFTAQTA